MSKTSSTVKNRYNAKVYDRVSLVLKKNSPTSKERVQQFADNAQESLNSYIVAAIQERMAREETATASN